MWRSIYFHLPGGRIKYYYCLTLHLQCCLKDCALRSVFIRHSLNPIIHSGCDKATIVLHYVILCRWEENIKIFWQTVAFVELILVVVIRQEIYGQFGIVITKRLVKKVYAQKKTM